MTRGALYEIPTLQLGDLIYPRMSIIAHRSNFPVPLLLPATMFNNLIYEINNDGQGRPSAGAGAGCDCFAPAMTHRLNITVPDNESISRNLVIKYENERLYVFCASAE